MSGPKMSKEMIDEEFFTGYTPGEIAQILGCSRQNVNELIRTALKKLRPLCEAKKMEEFLK